jgi:hypothetical protein
MRMIPRKIDQETARELKSILSRLNINNPRVIIDLDKETVEVDETDYSIEDLLEVAGTLSPERGRELLSDVKLSREEWDR